MRDDVRSLCVYRIYLLTQIILRKIFIISGRNRDELIAPSVMLLGISVDA